MMAEDMGDEMKMERAKMSNPTKKRHVITLETKKRIIDVHVSAEKNSNEISKQFGIPAPTIRNILRGKAKILKAIDEGSEAKKARLQPVRHEDLDEAVLRWFKDARNKNATMSGPLLKEKAKELAKELAKPLRKQLEMMPPSEDENKAKLERKAEQLESFQASEGWLEKFKHRHSIKFKSSQGEATEESGHSHSKLDQLTLKFFPPSTTAASHQDMAQVQSDDQPEENDDELNTLWAELQANKLLGGNLNDFLSVDNQLAIIGGTLTTAQIAADGEIITDEGERAEAESGCTGGMMETEEPELPLITTAEAHHALKILQRFVEQDGDVEMQQMCNKFDDKLAEKHLKKLRQKSIQTYFQPV